MIINGNNKLVIDKPIKFLLIWISCCFTTILVTLLIYYNLLDSTLTALGIGIFLSGFVMYYLNDKIKVNKFA